MDHQTNFDLRKILDELQSNRISIENDRKSFEKVRREILVADEELNKMTERWDSLKKREKEMGDAVGVRTSDKGLLKIKIQVVQNSCNGMEQTVGKKRNDLSTVKAQLRTAISKGLECGRIFSRQWNCSGHGKKFRKQLQARRVEDMICFKKILQYELDDFLILKRKLEYAETEKNEMEDLFRRYAKNLRKEEARIRSKLKDVDNVYHSLCKKRKEVTETPEMSRLAKKIEETRESIGFWETRVSQCQKTLDDQRQAFSKLPGQTSHNPAQHMSDDADSLKRNHKSQFCKS